MSASLLPVIFFISQSSFHYFGSSSAFDFSRCGVSTPRRRLRPYRNPTPTNWYSPSFQYLSTVVVTVSLQYTTACLPPVLPDRSLQPHFSPTLSPFIFMQLQTLITLPTAPILCFNTLRTLLAKYRGVGYPHSATLCNRRTYNLHNCSQNPATAAALPNS